MKVAAVADTMEVVVKHAARNGAQTRRLQSVETRRLRILILDTDAHLIAFDAEDAPVGDDAAAHVLAEVFDRVFTRSGAIHRGVPDHLHQRPELGLVDPSDIEQCIAQ